MENNSLKLAIENEQFEEAQIIFTHIHHFPNLLEWIR